MDLNQLQQESVHQVAAAASLKELESLRIDLLGKSGRITELMKQLGTLPPEERKNFGQQVNVVKNAVQQAFDSKKETLETAALNARLQQEAVDITLPARAVATGKMHPISYVIEEIGEILGRLGFSHAVGPEIENEYFNFSALNIPDDHPARQDHDTFYFNKHDAEGQRLLLRTQTSNVQIHAMRNSEPPLRIMSIGRVYRCDSDMTHTPQFHQVEGLAIDKNIHFGHLKGTLQKMLEDYFEKKVELRLRPSYFPFTEPGAEVDVSCIFCGGDGCRVCKHTGWIEVLGSGMVHRNVLQAGGIDAEKWQGFAFGAGIERLAMLKYGINDLRMFFDSQSPFLNHFGHNISTLKVGL